MKLIIDSRYLTDTLDKGSPTSKYTVVIKCRRSCENGAKIV